MLKENLVQLGLTGNEAETYIFLLDVYKAKASEVGRHLKVTHPAAKKILDNLIGKKLIRSQEYGKTCLYFAEDGESIKSFVENQRRKLELEEETKQAIAEKTINLLKGKKALQKDVDTKIEFYKGQEGVEELSEQIANSNSKTVYEFVDRDLVLYNKTKDKNNYVKKYKENGISFKTFYTTSQKNDTSNNIDKIKLNKEKVVSPTAHVIVFDDKVSFSYITDDKALVIIKNKWLANTVLTLFNNVDKN